jgi:hypothetical protein
VRCGSDEVLRVGLAGMFAYVERGAKFDELAPLQDGDMVAEIADEGHGVRDEEIGKVMGSLQVAQEIDDLCADRDIEGADGLVEDKELRAECESASDVDALTLAAGELVGMAIECRGVEAYGCEHLGEACGDALFGLLLVDGEGFGEDLLDAHAWVERSIGILKDDLHAAAQSAELVWFGCQEIMIGEADGASCGLDEAEEHAGYCALPGAGLAYEAEGFTASDVEGDLIDNTDFRWGSAGSGVLFHKVRCGEQDVGLGQHKWDGSRRWQFPMGHRA